MQEMPRHCLTLIALLCFLGTTVFLWTRPSSSLPNDRDGLPRGSLLHHATAPYTSSWGSWWHPRRQTGTSRDGATKGGWNILYHLGGNSPWIEKVDGVVKGGIGPPEGCRVEQVHMVCPHCIAQTLSTVEERHGVHIDSRGFHS